MAKPKKKGAPSDRIKSDRIPNAEQLLQFAQEQVAHRVEITESYKADDNKVKACVVRYDSPADYTGSLSTGGWRCETARVDADKMRWTYGEAGTREETLERCRIGIVPGASTRAAEEAEAEAYSVLDKDIIRKHSVKATRKYFAAGANVNLARYLDNEPDCFGRIKRGAKKRTIRLGINFVASCGNGEETFYKTAGRAIGLAKALEKLGYATEIVGIGYFQHSGYAGDDEKLGRRDLVPLVNVKSSSERFDPQKIACLAYPSMLRDFGFLLADATVALGVQKSVYADCGYGRAMDVPEGLKSILGLNAIIGHTWKDGDQRDFLTGVLQG